MLETNVQKLLYFGDDNSLLIFDFNRELRLIFRERLQFFTNLVQLHVAQPEFRAHRTFAWLAIADAGSLVPDDVIAAQVCHQHEHIESVSHGKQRSTEMGADVVGVPPTQFHLDVDRLHVGRDALDPDASAEKGRPQVYPAPQCTGTARSAEQLE